MNLNNTKHYISVTEFGAKGDGSTDDTQAIQNAINSLTGIQRSTLVFPPTNGKFYLVNELTIPENTHVITLIGIGDARIEFTGKIGFHIKSEFIIFKDLGLTNKTARDTHVPDSTILFNDERPYKILDFDIKAISCDINWFQNVVKTWGRGVELLRNNFADISGNIIYLTVLPESEIEFGHYDIQEYKTGYRGYIIKDNRIHYCNSACIMKTIDDTKKVVQGVQIQNNQIEGGIGYYNGYVRNAIITGNNHYHADTKRSSLFTFNGFDNVIIDINIDGMQKEKDGYTKRIERLMEVNDYGKGLKIGGNLSGLTKHCITFYKGASQIDINLNVDDVFGENNYIPSLLVITGTETYEGIRVGGSFRSEHPETIVVQQTGNPIVSKFKYDQLQVLGSFDVISNIVSLF